MSKVKNIVNASLFARTFAAILDLVITIFIGAGIYLGISNIAMQVNWIKAYRSDYEQTIVDSGLMYLKDGKVTQYEYESYETYEALFYDFYHNFYASETKQEYDIYWFNIFIYGQDDILNLYSDAALENRPSLIKIIGPTLFTYQLDEGTLLTDVFALPRDSENGTVELNKSQKEQLKNYFYVADEAVENNPIATKYKFIYYYALSDLTSLPKLQNDYDHYAFYASTLPLVIAIFVTFLIFYFIIPLCFKNGETIGKKIMHICLVNKLGYQYSRLQLIPRFLFPTFLIILVIFFTGFSIWSLLIISFVFLISYLFVIFGKENKALHDYFAGTLVIDQRQSTWFKNAREEQLTEEDVARYVNHFQSQQERHTKEDAADNNPHFKDE